MNTKPTIKNFLIVIVTAIIVLCIFLLVMPKTVDNSNYNQNLVPNSNPITNFADCAATGNPVMESYPRQCRYGEQTFTEDIGTELEKTDLIQVDFPRPNQVIDSPLTITGQARGTWFFEASFPVVLTDWDGLIIAQGIATTMSDWMTSEFVPFTATLIFTPDPNAYSNKGFLILQKDNPSGLPKNDDALEIPVILGTAEPAGNTGILP